MKSDVALDYAVFQLTPSRNRCELVVVCGEEVERLASGLLKPFLVHLKAAEDQYATGTKEIKLKPPLGYGYGSKPETSAWFTKGTIERFVRFVSTPEVLERVGTVEAELVQLEGAIREHANESSKVDASQPGTTNVAPTAGGSVLSTATIDRAPTPSPSRSNSIDGVENPAPDENARRRLLRAMEARKMLLHKEQGMAFARATAAGFDMQKMEHLLVFADCFGAIRLGDACVVYTGIFKKSKESGLWDENGWPLSDTTSLRNVPTSPELRPRESDLWSDMHSESGDFRLDDLRDDVSVRSYSNYYSEDLSLRGYSGADMLRGRSSLEQAPTMSPRRVRDFGGEHVRGQGGSNQASWDEGSRISQGQETSGISNPDDGSILNSNGNSRRIPSVSFQHTGLMHGPDNGIEPANDPDASNLTLRGHRQRRAWGPPPQFLAQQIPVGVKAKSGPLLPGGDGYHLTTPGNHNNSLGGGQFTSRIGENLPSWVAAAGQSDQPWRPNTTDTSGHTVTRLVAPKSQAQLFEGNGDMPESSSLEQVAKPPETNGNVLPSPAKAWQDHKRRHGLEVPERTGSNSPATTNPIESHSATSSKEQESRPAVKSIERPSNKSLVRRASSPRRRSSSPMRRVQVGRNSMRRSGLMIMKSVNYASTKPAGNAQLAAEESERSEEEAAVDTGEGNGSLSQQGVVKPGLGWRDGLRVDTGLGSFSNFAQESQPDHSPSRASSGWNTPVEYETDYPDNGSEHATKGQTARGELLSPKEPKGRFYEQYREKRDARLREESESKKAEKDAKLKSMQEVLERRKAEMAARKGRGSLKPRSDGEAQLQAEKMRLLKNDLEKSKKHKDDDESKRLEDIGNQRRERIAARGSPSPPSAGTASTVSASSTPRAPMKQPTTPTPLPTLIPTPSLTPKAKPSAVRRLSPPKKVSTGAFRGTVSSPAAPASAPKLVRANQRRQQIAPQIKEVENPMSRSVPSLAELRKENTKPALARNSTYNERPRSTGTKLPGMRSSSAPLDQNGSRASPRAPSADDKKRRVATRKSTSLATESSVEAPILASLKSSKAAAEQTVTTKPNKRLSLTSATNTDSKPFLRKGRGIGPGSGPNVRKSKVAAAPESMKFHEEEADKTVGPDSHPVQAEGDSIQEDVKTSNNLLDDDKSAIVRPDPPHASQTSDSMTPHLGTPPHRLSLALDDDDEMIRPEEWQESESVDDPESSGRELDPNTDQYASHLDLLHTDVRSSTLRHFLDDEPENSSVGNTAANGAGTPPQRSSPIRSIPLRSLSPKTAEVPDLYKAPGALPGDGATSPQVQYDVSFTSMSEAFAVQDGANPLASGSPYVMSPAPQPQQSLSPDAPANSKLRKKWGISQKVTAPTSVKESPRGLKRLLKFGRKKDKSSAASTTSDSPSDIDDDFDSEHGGRTDELTHIGAKSIGSRLSGKASVLMGPPVIPEDSAAEGDVGTRLVSIPFVRSSIPAAPAHFKTRDEHVGGSSLLKAPRSFFSLSSFRSKAKG